MSAASAALLAVDTCGACPGAGLWDGKGEPTLVSFAGRPLRAEGLSLCVQELLDARGIAVTSIAALAVLTGPGSYTGLRTGLAFVRGVALLDALPVVAVSALERLAFCAGQDGEGIVALWPGGPDLLLAGAYEIRDGLPWEVEAAAALDADGVDALVARCKERGERPWAQAIDRAAEGDRLVAEATNARGIAGRVADSQSIDALVRLAYRRFALGLGVSAELVLPDYFGTSMPRVNRNRVAGSFLA